MKKYIFLFLLLISQLSMAQIFVDFNAGYAIPQYKYNEMIMHNNPHNENYYQVYDANIDTSYSWVEYIKFNPSKGFFIKAGLGYQLKNFNFLIETDYFNNRKTATDSSHNQKYYEIHSSLPMYYNNDTIIRYSHLYGNIRYFLSWLSIIPKISYGVHIKKLSIFTSAGLSFDYLTIYKNDLYYIYQSDNNEEMINSGLPYSLTKYKYLPFITITGVIGGSLLYELNNHWSLVSNFSFQRKLYKSKKVIQYYSEQKRSYTGEIIISNEEKEVEKDYDYIPLSNYRISFGLRYSFGKKEKAAEEK